MAEYFDLQTNIPMTGVPKYASESKSKNRPDLPPRLRLTGTWDGLGQGAIFLRDHDKALGVLRHLGVITGDPKEGKYGLEYQVVSKAIRIVQTEVKTGTGRASLPQEITLADGTSPAPTGQHRRQEAPPAAGTGRPAPAANGRAPQQGEDDATRFGRLKAMMAKCVAFACETWERRSPEVPWEVMAATAHSLFIEAHRQGIKCQPLTEAAPQPIQQPPQRQQVAMVTAAQLAEIDRLRAAWGANEDDLDGQLRVWFNAELRPSQLTTKQAEWAIQQMKRQLVDGGKLPHAG